jgi:ubiquinone biosynthesis protein
MLAASRIPSPLVPHEMRAAVPILPVTRPSRFRTAYVLFQFAKLMGAYLQSILLRGRHAERFAPLVRETFEQMGGLWIKAGQVLALRIDLLPADLCTELASLQSRALGFPGDDARRIVEASLDAPLDRYFDAWVDAPIAAASIGQVHRARLRQEQIWVAVKIQKPYSRELFALDFRVITWLVRVIQFCRIYPHMKWPDGIAELQQIMHEELDFGFEAASTRAMRRLLKAHGAYVPTVFDRYCAAHVLVTEYVDMVLMADYLRIGREDPSRLQRWRRDNNVRPRLVAKRLVRSFQRQMLEDNRYHGDMHPGNIGLLRDSRVVLIDFGTTNFTEAEYLGRFRLFMRALAMGDSAKGADLSLTMAASLPPLDLSLIQARLTQTLQAWSRRTLVKELPFHDKSMDNLTNEMIKVLLGFRCTMEWAWLRLHRASSTLDASLIELDPGIDYRSRTRQYFEAAERRRLQSALTPEGARRLAVTTSHTVALPERGLEYVQQQSRLIRRQARVIRSLAGNALETLVTGARLIVMSQAVLAVFVYGALSQNPSSPSALFGWIRARIPVEWLADPSWLAVVLFVDVWIWLALARIKRATADDATIPLRAVVTS